MLTLAHEFGHVYDLNSFSGDAQDYNRYVYMSFYHEIVSKLFEKLFIEYLI